jgi:tRNA A37 threonylcarbamoyladenosine dehydratase
MSFSQEERFSRTALLLGDEALARLKAAHVAVFGIGGVGGYTVEALARSGVGALDLIDPDQVCVSNINRQLLATEQTVGQDKVEVARDRIQSISPDCAVTVHKLFFLPETAAQINFSNYDYVIDAIDTVTGKLALVSAAKEADVPIISCMGTGNKLNPMLFRVGDLYETDSCPLARIMRRECRKRGIGGFKGGYSTEKPLSPKKQSVPQEALRRDIPGSIAFVPAAAGLLLASEVIKDLLA